MSMVYPNKGLAILIIHLAQTIGTISMHKVNWDESATTLYIKEVKVSRWMDEKLV